MGEGWGEGLLRYSDMQFGFPRTYKNFVYKVFSIYLLFLAYPSFRYVMYFEKFLRWEWLVSLFVIVVSLTTVIGLILFCLRDWAYRVDFHNTFLETHAGRLLFQQRFQYAYDDIGLVSQGPYGQIVLLPRKGKTLRLNTNQFEGGHTKVFDTLIKYIPEERFDAAFHKRRKIFDMLLHISGITVLCSFVIFAIGSQLTSFPISAVWTYFDPWLLARRSILGGTIDSSDSVWIVSRYLLEPEVSIEHISANQTQTWYVPADNELRYSDVRVLLDSHQQPVLVTNSGFHVLKDGVWQKQDFQADTLKYLFARNMLFGFTNEHWGLSKDGKSLIHIQPDSLKLQTVPLLDPVTQKSLTLDQVKIAVDGTALVLANNTIYLLRNGEIQQQVYPIARQNTLDIADFVLTHDGNMYVLFSQYPHLESFVEIIDSQGRQTLTQLPVPYDEYELLQAYKSLAVDVHGRLWLTEHGDVMHVFEPVWDGSARELVRYDEYNSNYESDNLLYTSDGRIWAVSDGVSDHLIWIDSNATELPKPLPTWIADIRQNSLRLLIFILIFGLIYAVFMFAVSKLMYK